MKKSLTSVFFGMIAAAVFAAEQPAQNLVSNGGFEKVDANGKVEGWSGSNFLSTEQPFEGKNCVKLAKAPKASYHSISSSAFAVTAGTEYTITLQFRGEAGYVYAQFLDANGKGVGTPHFWMGQCKEWKTKTFKVKAPANAAKCCVLLRTFSEKDNYFDNVSFVAGTGK